MCGICGIINLKKRTKINKEIIRDMNKLLHHRGPDDEGYYFSDYVCMGHKRLSILDLSKKGRQPMKSRKGSLIISYNGEVYNFKEIREELIKKGYTFKSKSDTEVILKSYEEWGINCLKKFNGMFAFALYDKKKDIVFLVRDRLGIKPLYYSIFDDRLIFGSEIKSILQYPGFKRKLNKEAISSYLSYRYVLGKETLFKNIYKLLPGQYLKIKKDKIQKSVYWKIPLPSFDSDKGEEFYINKIRKLVIESVKKRMISDVPLGAYLSGGLDSSIIVSILAKNMNKPVNTYTIGFKEKGFNEFKYSKEISNMYRTNHKEIILDIKNYFETIINLIQYKDLPLSVPNEVPLFLMSKELKKDITVVLSGEGADEIFGGYGKIFRSPTDYKKLQIICKFPKIIQNKVFNKLIERYGKTKFDSELKHFLT